jgi:hypothetical protein
MIIFLRVFLSLTKSRFEAKERRITMQGMSNQSSCNIELYPHMRVLSSKLDFAAKFKLGVDGH